MELYDTAAAAAYCGLSIPGFKHHAQRARVLPLIRSARARYYTKEELDRFKAQPIAHRGKPRKQQSS